MSLPSSCISLSAFGRKGFKFSALIVFISCFNLGLYAQSPHTIAFTGSATDFNASEGYTVSIDNVDYYMTFDASNIYLGAFKTTGNFNSTDNLTVYLDTDPQLVALSGTGTNLGQNYNGVTGTLPFTANYTIHAEQSTQEARSFGGAWAATISGLSYFTSSTCREVVVPKTSIGNPDALYLSFWMGQANAIFANAPGATLGGVANPAVTNFFGGIGLMADDCLPLSTQDLPLVDVLTDALPNANETVARLIVSSANLTSTNNFQLAPGGSIEIAGGSLHFANATIDFGGQMVSSGKGTQMVLTSGSLSSAAAAIFNINGEVKLLGIANSFGNQWVVKNKLTLLSSGGTTIGSGGKLDFRSGGYLSANALLYDNGSTLAYNAGTNSTVGLEWTAGASTGVGVPFQVEIASVVANSALNFGSSTNYRRCAGNLTIANSGTSALTLSNSAGGDLQIGGNFNQNGTFIPNNRSVTFNGASNQSVNGNFSGTGASNNFFSLIVANTVAGGVTLNNNTVVTAASGDVLQLVSAGRLNIGTGVNLNFINNGGNVLVSGGARTIRFNSATSSLSFSGSKTITNASGGSLNLSTLAAGAYLALAQGVNFGANLTTINTNVAMRLDNGGAIITNAPIYAVGSTLQYNTGSAIGRGLEWSTITGAGYPHHVSITSPGTVLNLGNGGAGVARQIGGDLTIQDGCTLSMATTPMTAALSVLGHLNIGNGGSGALVLSTSNGGNLNVRGNVTLNAGSLLTHNNRIVTLNGTTNQTLSGLNTLYDLVLNNTAGATLASPLTVSNVFTLTSGSMTLGNNNLTLTNTALGAITGTFSATRMLVTNGTGQLIRAIATTGLPINYVWPIGESTGSVEYTPMNLNFTANSVARQIGFLVVDGDHPDLNNTPVQTDYISRYWSISNSASGTYTYNAAATYVANDIVGSESNIRMNSYGGGVWRHDIGSSSTANVLNSSAALTNATGPLTTGETVTGRVNSGVIYVWNQTSSANFTTATNWTPNRTTTRVNDILVFSNGATTTATNVPTQTIGQLLISGNSNVTFTSAANVVLTIAGSNGSDFDVASGSTLIVGATGNNSVTIAHANSPTTSIAGVLQINANTALTNAINFTNTTGIISGTLNNFGAVTSSAVNLNFLSGAIYNHNFTTTAGNIPIATWHNNATCRIQGYTNNSTPGNLSQSFGHFIWNCPAQTGNTQLAGGLTTINGQFTVSSTGSGALFLNNNTNYTLQVGGDYSQSGNSTVRLSTGNGAYTANMNVLGAFVLSGSTTNFTMHAGNASTSANLSVGANFTVPAGCGVLQTVASSNNSITWNGAMSQNVTIAGTMPTQQMHYRLDNSSGMVLSGTIYINAQSTFYRRAGAITGGTISYNATSGSLAYEGSNPMTTGLEFPNTNGPVNVTMNATSSVQLSAARSLPPTGVFTNTSGVFILGANDLTLNNTAAGALVNSTPSSTNMIAADGTGQLKRTLPSGARDLNFYIGDVTSTSEYSGIRLNFSSNTVAGRVVGIRVVDDSSSVLSLPYSPIDYLTRHWVVTLSSTTGSYAYTPSITYNVMGDVEGTENNLQLAAFPTLASSWNHYATALVSPVLTKSGAALTESNFSLNGAVFTGRTPVKYWDGSISTNWNDANNWTPSGIPVAADNIDVNGNALNPLILNSTATVNHFTFSDGGNFTLGASGNLTVAGNLTFSSNASTAFNCGSTLQLTNTTFNQTIPALQYGNLNLGAGNRTLSSAGTISICGNYTPTTGTLVSTGSSVDFNGASAQAILNNATAFNNLTISNGNADVSSASNVTVNGSLQIAANARFNKTAGTLTIGASGSGNVSGFLRNAGTVTPTGTLTFAPTGVYEHNHTTTTGTVPTAVWSTGSLCKFMGYTTNTTVPGGMGQNFHHMEWNCPNQSGNLNMAGALTTIGGDFRMVSSGTGQLRLSNASGANISIAGDLVQSGGELFLKTGNNNQTTLNIGGDLILNSGILDGNSGNNGYTEIRLSGNYERTGSHVLTTSGNTADNTLILFQGVNQSILHTSTGATSYFDYHIASGSTTTLLSNFALNTFGVSAFPVRFDIRSGGALDCQTFELSGVTGISTRIRVMNGSTIRTAHLTGLTASGLAGAIQTDNRVYDSGATYIFDGIANQNTGNFWTVTSTPSTVANLILDNTASLVSVNSASNVSVSSQLTFTSSNTAALDMGSNTISMTNAAVNAVVRNGLGHVIGNLSRAILPSATNTYSFHVGTISAYSPVISTLTMGATAGSIIAKATDGAHPQMASDGLSQTAICNRYWTITNNGSTINSASHQLYYQNADLLGGATSTTLSLARYASGWTYPTYSTSNLMIQGNGLNNTTSFGEFFAAANCADYQASIAASSSTNFCNGESVTLTASSNIPGSSYTWSPSTGLSATTGAAVVATPSSSIIYTVTATSPQNCIDTETISVVVYPLPTATIAGPSVACEGSAVAIGFFGTPNTTAVYKINAGADQNVTIDGTGVGSVNFTLNGTTTVQLVGSYSANCAQTLNQTITVTTINIDAQIAGTTTICGATSTDVYFTGTPGANVIYAINGGANQMITLNGAGAFTLNTGVLFTNRTYQLISVSNGSCSKALSQAVTIMVNAIPDATFIGGGAVCGGTSQTVQVVGSPNAVVQYMVNGGGTQSVTLNGSGMATISTGALNTATTYLLVSATIGSCTEFIGIEVAFNIIGNTYYQDNDGDGFGNDAITQVACTAPVGYVSLPGDCNDSNAGLSPYTDWYGDMDGDGYGGFIYATQCTDPNIPGVVALGGDCDDNNAMIHNGQTEVCGNGVDDNCNGLIDEGCVVLSNDSIVYATNIQSYVNAYPVCTAYSSSTVGSHNSTESVGFSGKDRWYKFQAAAQSARVALTTSTWNAAIQVCNQSYAPLVGGSSNVQNSSGSEILILNNLNVGQWYYISVGGINNTDAGQFSLCVQYFASSGCNTNTSAPLDICSTFKPRYAGASTYTYQFVPINAGMGGGSLTSSGAITLSQPGLNLIPGQSYNVSIASTFSNLTNGIGQPLPNVTTFANATCLVSIAAHSDMQVRTSQRCSVPATLLRSTYMRADPFVCSVTNYTFEFTPTSGCSDYQGIGLPFTITNLSRILQLNFNGTTTSPMGQTVQPQTYYIVRIRPNFGVSGAYQGVYGTPQIIYVGGALMAEYDDEVEPSFAFEEQVEESFIVYPNPSLGERVVLESLTGQGAVRCELFDQLGNLIATKDLVADHGFRFDWLFDSQLASGLYHIQWTNGDRIERKKFVVSR